MQCPSCSNDNPAGATFCQRCGASLTGAPSAAGGYTQVPQSAPAPGPVGGAPYAPVQSGGLSDSAAGAIAYITIIPAIVFLLLEPYNHKPFVRFHSVQCIGLHLGLFIISIVFSILGAITAMLHLGFLLLLLWPLLWLASVILWLLCVINAAQGKWFKLPIVGDFAMKQSRQ